MLAILHIKEALAFSASLVVGQNCSGGGFGFQDSGTACAAGGAALAASGATSAWSSTTGGVSGALAAGGVSEALAAGGVGGASFAALIDGAMAGCWDAMAPDSGSAR